MTRGRPKTAGVLRRGLRLAPPALGAAFVAFAVVIVSLGLAVHRDLGCAGCHGVFAAAVERSAHSSVPCGRCHARPGIGGLLADGLRYTGCVASAIGGRSPSGTFPGPETCLQCHGAVRTETIVSGGLAVRHSDFIGDTPCTRCHGGTGHRLDGRVQRAPHMEDCLGCHETGATDLDGCGLCHGRDTGNDDRARKDTSWRVSHGPEWRRTHGMGDVKTCASCHPVGFCAKCHGVKLPHALDWPATHGGGLDGALREKCVTCHEPSWCSACHGIEMPHPGDFMPRHGTQAEAAGGETCARCHDSRSCDACHFASSHPNVPVSGSHGERSQ